jgi:hypothetical protein
MYKIISAALLTLSLTLTLSPAAFAIPVSDEIVNVAIQRMNAKTPGTMTVDSIAAVVAVAGQLMADQPLNEAFLARTVTATLARKTIRQAMGIIIAALPNLDRANRYRLSIGETIRHDRPAGVMAAFSDADEQAVLQSKVTTHLTESEGLLGRMARFAADASSLSVHEIGGYSGAGYGDQAQLKASLRARILALVAEDTQVDARNGGTNAKTAFICGGTVDGVGVVYDVINEMRLLGEIDSSKIMVAGIVADQAVGYHLEGLEKDWGDTISPHQDALLLVNTFAGSDGKQSWEVKESSDARSMNSRILDNQWLQMMVGLYAQNAVRPITVRTSVEVFEGGPIAFDEPLEALISNYVISGGTGLQINAHRGFETKKRAKDQGARAATDLATLATILGTHPLARQIHATDVATAPLAVDPASAEEQALAQRRSAFIAGLRARALAFVEQQVDALRRSEISAQRYFDNRGVSAETERAAYEHYAQAHQRAQSLIKALGCGPMLEPQP